MPTRMATKRNAPISAHAFAFREALLPSTVRCLNYGPAYRQPQCCQWNCGLLVHYQYGSGGRRTNPDRVTGHKTYLVQPSLRLYPPWRFREGRTRLLPAKEYMDIQGQFSVRRAIAIPGGDQEFDGICRHWWMPGNTGFSAEGSYDFRPTVWRDRRLVNAITVHDGTFQRTSVPPHGRSRRRIYRSKLPWRSMVRTAISSPTPRAAFSPRPPIGLAGSALYCVQRTVIDDFKEGGAYSLAIGR